jgi:peptide/nickel transport system permease protein
MVVALVLAIPLGLLSAYKKDTVVDQGSMLFALLGISMPNFWLGPLLIIVFSLKLGWLPVSGRGSLAHIVLPAITLGTAMAAILTRMTRASMLDVIQSDYITTARAKGVRESRVVLKHAFRNALIPVVTIVGLQIGGLLAGSIITETIFAWPGIGRLAIQAINARDYPLVQGCVLVIALGYVLVNFLTDLLYGLIDPRIRYE